MPTLLQKKAKKTAKGAGAADWNRFSAMDTMEHPLTRRSNDYVKHLSKNIIGYATYCPRNLPVDPVSKKTIHGGDRPFTFKSMGNLQRLLNLHCSEPIYFAQDWDTLGRISDVRLSREPMDREVLDKELELACMTYEELTANAKLLDVYESAKDKTKKGLITLCLNVEFGAERVKNALHPEV